MRFSYLLVGAVALAGASQAGAVTVNWSTYISATSLGSSSANTVNATISTVDGNVGYTYTGATHFVDPASNQWTGDAYTNGVVTNGPPNPGLNIALGEGGVKTIVFDRPVSDVYFALLSWNGNAGVFDQPFEVISSGSGAYGNGSFTNVTPVSFTGSGELHGVIRFTGTFSQVSFTDVTEYWHGIQVGIGGIAPPPPPPAVPEPATWGMLLLGFGLAGAALRRKRAGAAIA